MLLLQFVLHSSYFVGTLKNEIPEAALELCQLKIKQLSPDILKFRTKHEDNPFTLNCSVVPRSFLLVFHAGLRGLGSNNSRNSIYKKKWPVRPVFPDYLSVSYDYAKSKYNTITHIVYTLNIKYCTLTDLNKYKKSCHQKFIKF